MPGGQGAEEKPQVGSECAGLRATGTPRDYPCRSGDPENTFTRRLHKNRDHWRRRARDSRCHKSLSWGSQPSAAQRTHRPQARDPGRPLPARPAGATASETARRTTSQRRAGPLGHTEARHCCTHGVRKIGSAGHFPSLYTNITSPGPAHSISPPAGHSRVSVC